MFLASGTDAEEFEFMVKPGVALLGGNFAFQRGDGCRRWQFGNLAAAPAD
jgi:hypothetical protein